MRRVLFTIKAHKTVIFCVFLIIFVQFCLKRVQKNRWNHCTFSNQKDKVIFDYFEQMNTCAQCNLLKNL